MKDKVISLFFIIILVFGAIFFINNTWALLYPNFITSSLPYDKLYLAFIWLFLWLFACLALYPYSIISNLIGEYIIDDAYELLFAFIYMIIFLTFVAIFIEKIAIFIEKKINNNKISINFNIIKKYKILEFLLFYSIFSILDIIYFFIFNKLDILNYYYDMNIYRFILLLFCSLFFMFVFKIFYKRRLNDKK